MDTAVATRRPSAARERILSTADRLFYSEGIHAVGIERVVKESSVTRVTLYRHFPSKDDLVSAYLQRRAQDDRGRMREIIDAHPSDPRAALRELATTLVQDDFGPMQRGCPFINASAEFTPAHPARAEAHAIRRWVTDRLEELLSSLRHSSPRATAEQLMMLRTGAVVSRALDGNEHLGPDYVAAWEQLIDAGLARAS